jgi:hypothetical protein
MNRLRKYVEWMSRGRRIAYVMKDWDLPLPLPGAEWQLDAQVHSRRRTSQQSGLEGSFQKGAR